MNSIETIYSVEVKTEQLVICPHCSSDRLNTWCVGNDRLHGLSDQQFVYSKCQSCNLIFLSSRPSEKEAYKLYPDEYAPYKVHNQNESLPAKEKAESEVIDKTSIIQRLVGGTGRKALLFFTSFFNYFSDKTLQVRIQIFYKPKLSGLKLVDFGCGSVNFLNYAEKEGWQPIGVDFSDKVVENVKCAGYKGFLISEIESEIENESVDAVRMHHVLEHLYYPRNTLKLIHSKMKPGGIIHIAIPNPEGMIAKTFRKYWRDLDCPRHVILYSPNLVEELLIELGFHDIEVFYEVYSKDLVGSLNYFSQEQQWLNKKLIERAFNSQSFLNISQAFMKAMSHPTLSSRFHVFAKK